MICCVEWVLSPSLSFKWGWDLKPYPVMEAVYGELSAGMLSSIPSLIPLTIYG